MNQPKILAFAGSARKDSLNKKFVQIAARTVKEAGASVTVLDLKDYLMPLYDGDTEAAEGIPQTALKLKELMKSHDGLLLACPEYNSSITPLLKNTIDWVSRPIEGEPQSVAFRGKVAALLSASPGVLGGLRGLVHVRSILGNIGVLVIPNQVAIPKANEAFAADGTLKDTALAQKVAQLSKELVNTTRSLVVGG